MLKLISEILFFCILVVLLCLVYVKYAKASEMDSQMICLALVVITEEEWVLSVTERVMQVIKDIGWVDGKRGRDCVEGKAKRLYNRFLKICAKDVDALSEERYNQYVSNEFERCKFAFVLDKLGGGNE